MRQRGAQALADLAADLVCVRDHAIQGGVFGQPLGGGFRTAFGHARHVVDGIAGKRKEIDDLVRSHAEFFHYPGAVHECVAHGVDQRHLRAHQLSQILVAGGDQHLEAQCVRLHGQRADHVIGFHPGYAQNRKTERADDRQHRLDLRAQIVRHRWAVCLVLVIKGVAEGRAGGVADKRQIVRPGLQRGAQHIDHAKQRTGRLAVGVGQRRQRMKRAIQVRGTVDEN